MTRRRSLLLSIGTIALAFAFALLPGGPFHELAGATSPSANPAAPSPGEQMGMQMQDMSKMHEKMMADMKAAQTRLDDLATKMNAATGEAKTGAMVELLNELVRQHRAMGQRMGDMDQRMIGQMKMMR